MTDRPAPPYVIVVSDGVSIRTIHAPALPPQHRAALHTIVMAALEPARPASPPAVPQKPNAPTPAETMTQGEIARTRGYSGDACPSCMNFTMKRTGTCLTCASCGFNQGCG